MNNLIITIYLVYLRYEKFDALFFELQVDTYAYLPPNYDHSIECDVSATIVVFERRFVFCTSPFIWFLVDYFEKALESDQSLELE